MRAEHLCVLQRGRNLSQRNVQPAQQRDRQRAARLCGGVVAIAGCRVDFGRDEQAELVVVAQLFGAEPANPGELANRQQVIGHTCILILATVSRSTQWEGQIRG